MSKVADYVISKDMKSFKKTIDLSSSIADNNLTFTGDIAGQIVTVESGKNIVTKVFSTQDVSYRKVVVEVGAKETKGKNKGKFKIITKTYKAVVDKFGEVDGWEETSTDKVSYAKKGENSTTYQMLNSKGKVIETSTTSYEGASTTVVDTSKTLGTITFTNGNNTSLTSYSIGADETPNKTKNILQKFYAPAKKKNTYTGNWQNEEVDSTSANETFNLGAGDNIINLNMSQKIGKDSVVLSKEGTLTLNVAGGAPSYTRSGNNIIVKGSVGATIVGEDYQRVVTTIKKDGNSYKVESMSYNWNEETEEYDIPASLEPAKWTMSASEYAEVKESMSHSGVNYSVGTFTYYQNISTYQIVSAGASTGYVTLKNYLKNAVDNVYVGDTSLKTVLEDSDVAKLGNAASKKKQKITGTFLGETFTGGSGNDTITSGAGIDKIYLSGGKDKITINGNGTKYVQAQDSTSFGSTVFSFGKGLTYDTERTEDPAKTGLFLSGVYSDSDYHLSFVKSGNDLILDNDTAAIISNRFNGTKFELTGSKITVTDFFKNEDIKNSVVFGYNTSEHEYYGIDGIEDLSLVQLGNTKKANKLSDTTYNDTIVGGKKADTITVSNKGDDLILLDSGNDKIYIKQSADGSDSFKTVAQTVIGAGVDTINIEAGSNPDLLVSSVASKLSSDKAKIEYEKTGNDLTVKSTYFKTPNGLKKDTTDSIVIKDYFASFDENTYYNKENIVFFAENTSLGEALGEKRLKINAVYKNKEYDYDGTEYNDEFTYSGKNKSAMSETKVSNDVYNLTINKNSNLSIYDWGGQDVIKFDSNSANLRLFFNVNKDGSVSDTTVKFFDKSTYTSKNLKNAVVKGQLTGAAELNIAESQRAEGSSYKFYNNAGREIAFDNWYNQIKSNVASWLTEKGIANSSTVLTGNDTNAIKELLQCYNVDCSNYV